MLVELLRQPFQWRRHARAHLPHHVDRIHAGRRGQREHVLGHLQRHLQQRVGLDQAIQKSHLVEPLGREAEAQRHLGGDRMREPGQEPVVVAAEQPALGLGDLEDRAVRGDAQIRTLHELKAAAHREPIDGADHGLGQRAVHERVVDGLASQAHRAALDGLFHVLARAERASRTREDRDLQLVRIAELAPRRGQAGA